MLRQEHPGYEARNGAAFADKSREAVGGRKKIRELKKQKRNNDTEQKQSKKRIIGLKEQVKKKREWLKQHKGPFGKKFQAAMDDLKLERQVYHSEAMIGRDINKVFSQETSMHTISAVFLPISVSLVDGSEKIYGSHTLVPKVSVMLHKFASIYNLMARSRPLCKHEVVIIHTQNHGGRSTVSCSCSFYFVSTHIKLFPGESSGSSAR